MKRLLAPLALFVALLAMPAPLFAQAAAPAQNDAVDLSTPEAAVKSLLSAFSTRDMKRLTACVEGAHFTADSEKLEKLMKADADHPILTADNFHLEIKDDRASGMLTLTAQIVFGPNSPTPKDPAETASQSGLPASVTLHQVGKDWLVVPTKVDSAQPLLESPLVAATLAAAQPGALVAGRNAAYGVRCLSHMKFLSLALLEYTSDHNDRFALKTETLHTSLLPYLTKEEKTYVKSPRSVYADTERNVKLLAEQPFHCPIEEAGGEISCRFNKNLEGLSVLTIPENVYETLIALYEGDEQTLSFRHNGKAVVGLASGKARLVTPEEAKKLRWKP